MWTLWTKAKTFHKLPSEIADPRGRWDDLTRYQFDNAVTYFGLTLENALQETVEMTLHSAKGPRVTHKPKYTLGQLLDPSFRLPRPQPVKSANPWQPILDMVGKSGSGIKAWRYVAPPAKEV